MTKNIVTSIAIAALLIASTFAIAAPQDASGQTCTPAPPGLVSWWPGDGNANDIQDGNHGTLVGATFAAGKVGQAFSFDGINDKVVIPSFNVEKITIDAWINPVDVVTNKRIVTKFPGTGDSTPGMIVFDVTPNVLRFVIVSAGGTFNQLVSPAIITANEFQHVAATFDGSSMKLYKNGVLVASQSVSFTSIPTFNQVWVIGEDEPEGPGAEWFKGLIDEVEIYNRALTQEEIQTIVNAGSAGKCKAGPDLHPAILEEVQKIEEKLDGTRPSLITQISNAITNTILPALTSIQNALSSIQTSIAQVLGILQDPIFGLPEIKKEVSSIEQKLDSIKIPIKVDIGVARLTDHRFAILTTELGEQVDTEVVMVKAIKVKGGDDDDKKGIKIESKILTTSEFKVTKVQTGVFVLEILDKAKSASDVIELKVKHTHTDGAVHLGAIIFDKGVKENTNQ